MSARRRPPFKKPWQSPVPNFDQDQVIHVRYPNDEEDNGSVHIAWRMEFPVNDVRTGLALIVVMEYLTESSISPFTAAFVESDDPLASSVDYGLDEQIEHKVVVYFSDVPLNKLGEVLEMSAKNKLKILTHSLVLARLNRSLTRSWMTS